MLGSSRVGSCHCCLFKFIPESGPKPWGQILCCLFETFLLANCSSEKVTLSSALTKAEWKKSGIVIKIFLLFAQSWLVHNGPSLGLTRLILCWRICVAFKQLRTWGKDLGSICTFHRHAFNYLELCCDLQDFNLQGQRSILKVTMVSYSFCPLAVSMLHIELGLLSGKQTCSGVNKHLRKWAETLGLVKKNPMAIFGYCRKGNSIHRLEDKPLTEHVICWHCWWSSHIPVCISWNCHLQNERGRVWEMHRNWGCFGGWDEC